jgi:hypothetical protein
MFLTPQDQKAMEGTIKENISLDPPETEQESMNVVQTLRLARRLLADKSTPDEKKAVMLCWLMHSPTATLHSVVFQESISYRGSGRQFN